MLFCGEAQMHEARVPICPTCQGLCPRMEGQGEGSWHQTLPGVEEKATGSGYSPCPPFCLCLSVRRKSWHGLPRPQSLFPSDNRTPDFLEVVWVCWWTRHFWKVLWVRS